MFLHPFQLFTIALLILVISWDILTFVVIINKSNIFKIILKIMKYTRIIVLALFVFWFVYIYLTPNWFVSYGDEYLGQIVSFGVITYLCIRVSKVNDNFKQLPYLVTSISILLYGLFWFIKVPPYKNELIDVAPEYLRPHGIGNFMVVFVAYSLFLGIIILKFNRK